VIHTATGAWFIAYAGRPEIANENLGQAGAVSKTATTTAWKMFASWRRSFYERE
jgi:hypothetical protein